MNWTNGCYLISGFVLGAILASWVTALFFWNREERREKLTWYCPRCKAEVPKEEVNRHQIHDRRVGGCGSPVYFDRVGKVEVLKGGRS